MIFDPIVNIEWIMLYWFFPRFYYFHKLYSRLQYTRKTVSLDEFVSMYSFRVPIKSDFETKIPYHVTTYQLLYPFEVVESRI